MDVALSILQWVVFVVGIVFIVYRTVLLIDSHINKKIIMDNLIEDFKSIKGKEWNKPLTDMNTFSKNTRGELTELRKMLAYILAKEKTGLGKENIRECYIGLEGSPQEGILFIIKNNGDFLTFDIY